MKMTKKSLLVLLAVMVVAMFSMPANAFAVENPSANVQNGDICRYGDVVGAPIIDADFDAALGAGDVRLSQQVIADNGDGKFDVELKVQCGDNVTQFLDEAVVFLIDDSASINVTQYQQMKAACMSMVDAFPNNINVQFGIVRFSTNASIVSYLNSNRDTVKTLLSNLSNPTGNTNLYDGLQKAQTVLSTYTGNGPKHIVLITDGAPNTLPSGVTGNVNTVTLNKVNDIKNSGVFVYVAGYGSATQSFFTQVASSSEMCKIVNNAEALTDLLCNNNPVVGFLGNIAAHSNQNIAVRMGSEIEFVEVVSNSGGGYDLLASNGTLYWDPKPDGQPNYTGVSTLVYKIQMKPSALDQGFKPVSSSAIMNYTDANGRIRAEKFDIPQVQWRSFFTVTFVDYDGAVLDEQIIPKGSDAVAPDDPDNYYGYHFVGWDKGFTNVTEDLTVTAEYEINTYSVTFVDWDGTELDAQTIEHGSAAVAPADPARTGYTFIGWDVDFDYITGELTVTAQYEINVYTVSFYKQSQDNSNKVAKTPFATQEVTYDELIDFTKVSVGKNAVWYFTDGTTFGAKFDLSTPVTGDLMLAVKDQNNNQQ